MHQYGGEGTITGSAIDASVRLDVSMGRIDASLHQYGGDDIITGSVIDASIWRG